MSAANPSFISQGGTRSFQFTPIHSPQFYFPDGNITFLVNSTLYRVYKYPIQQASTVFAAMFELGHQDTAEGSADQDPIVLNAVLAEEFEAFLSSLFSTHWNAAHPACPTPATMTGKDWLTCYAACERWDAPSMKEIVVRNLWISPPAVRLAAGLRFSDLKDLISAAVLEFCKADCRLDSVHILPPNVLIQLIRTREDMARLKEGETTYTTYVKFRDFVMKLAP